MKEYDMYEVDEMLEFAKEALDFFLKNVDMHSYSKNGNPDAGDFIAIRNFKTGHEDIRSVIVIRAHEEPVTFLHLPSEENQND